MCPPLVCTPDSSLVQKYSCINFFCWIIIIIINSISCFILMIKLKFYPVDFLSISLPCVLCACMCVWGVIVSMEVCLLWAFGSEGSPYGSISGVLSAVKNDPAHTHPTCWATDGFQLSPLHLLTSPSHTNTTHTTWLIISRTILTKKSILKQFLPFFLSSPRLYSIV